MDFGQTPALVLPAEASGRGIATRRSTIRLTLPASHATIGIGESRALEVRQGVDGSATGIWDNSATTCSSGHRVGVVQGV